MAERAAASGVRGGRILAMWALGILIVALLAAAIYTAYLWRTGYLPVRTFDSVGWKTQSAPNIRVQMVDSLTSRYELRGMTRAQVIALLGPRDDTQEHLNWDFAYRLGEERGWQTVDSEWLVIRMDEEGRVMEWAVLRD